MPFQRQSTPSGIISLPSNGLIFSVQFSNDDSGCICQLAILASYSSNEVVAVYRYFRSLAVDTPFSTARDNLILAFEKVSLLCPSLISIVVYCSFLRCLSAGVEFGTLQHLYNSQERKREKIFSSILLCKSLLLEAACLPIYLTSYFSSDMND